ncbi:non-ribosomal peptide synthetase module [Paenibacillus motobuensis]|uniref:non-ribosomal peptide synthetase module n=1 Tax=Paenibacillus TaxID=44249 RepID=UPI00203CB8DF|nr:MULTISPECIES: non-ribosomal peptide synthetase module [Paenibacillus]MCM3041914.1 non-ribosomal peptide synthetase module [Paenibacillus lutimineralis]MCM3649018.1 non-ribosomal peptide synthetase module [Paenibacillus motobuensis]
MAQRLATEYVNASLRLSEAQMSQFVHKVYDPHVRQKVKVLENGSHEVVLEDDGGEEVCLPFDRRDGYYVCELSFRLEQPHLTNVMRLLFSAFKGSGLVTRVYSGFMMMYYYQEGRVRKIVEYSRDSYKLVFEHKDTAGRLQRLYHNNDVEQEISGIQESINALLDSRFVTNDPVVVNQIDDQLREHSRRLFVLEA